MSWCILVVLVATLPVASKREIDKAHREASVLCKFCDTWATSAKFSHLIRTTSLSHHYLSDMVITGMCTKRLSHRHTHRDSKSVPLQRTALRPCITVRPPKCAAILGGNGRQSDAWAKP
ncbi:hypothetical protein BJV77DRAFT_1023668 [Russula vinacea]|nr:hypothetical protein BJV77DRAFT_1023668 [Russula vinacea]